MRLSPLALLAGAWALARAQSLTEEDDPKKENTYFNSIKVPPLLELSPANWEAETSQTRWMMVKHYR